MVDSWCKVTWCINLGLRNQGLWHIYSLFIQAPAWIWSNWRGEHLVSLFVFTTTAPIWQNPGSCQSSGHWLNEWVVRRLSARDLAFPASSSCKKITKNEKITTIASKQNNCLSQGLGGNLPPGWKIRRGISGEGEEEPPGASLLTEAWARTYMQWMLEFVVSVSKRGISEKDGQPCCRTFFSPQPIILDRTYQSYNV